MTELTEGVKHDEDKPRYDLIPVAFLEGIAIVSGFGAGKYDEYNWAKGLKYSRVFRACIGHLYSWWRGEDNDQESGYSHLWHAACCLMYLCHYESKRRKYRTFNDRPKI